MNKEEKFTLITPIPYKSTLEETLTDLSCDVINLAEFRYAAGMHTIADMVQTPYFIVESDMCESSKRKA